MIAHRRRRLIWTVTRIVLITMLALIVEWGGDLARIETVFYDLRARCCQRHEPLPTDRLVHLDIDDSALDQIGRWPWDRDDMTEILEEIRLAGPKVLAMDVIFHDSTKPAYDEHGKKRDLDEMLAAEIRKFDGVLVPASLTFKSNISPGELDRQLTSMLTADPELTLDACRDRLGQKRFDARSLQSLDQNFLKVRPMAMYDRIATEMKGGNDNADSIKRKILPHSGPASTGLADRLFTEQYARALRDESFSRFTLAAPAGLPPVLTSNDALTPRAVLSQAAKYGAFVDDLPDHVDGEVRTVPLFAELNGRLIPHFGLVVACAILDVDIKNLHFSPDSVTIPQPDGNDITIPVSSRQTPEFGEVGMLMEVPMFGKKEGWLSMYDVPRHEIPAQHMSVREIWYACETRRRLETNETLADKFLIESFHALSLEPMDENDKRANAYANNPLRGAEQRKLIESTVENLHDLIEGYSSVPDLGSALKDKLEKYKADEPILREILRQDAALQDQLLSLRGGLRAKLAGRALFMGGFGTGNVDIVSTTLDSRCPGVIIHGAVFNAIMTRKLWRVAPQYVTYLIIIAFGLLIGLLVARLSPLHAFAATMAVCVGYLLINGYVLFDAHNLIVGISGPLFVAILVWSGVTIPNFIREIAERNRITRRFSNYVDPSLVNYVIEHPEQAKFDGEAREMTMGFTDLAGFTTLTESLGTRTIPLLAEYIGKMIPIIRNNQGYVSRLMGDGIYFFFNAPGLDPDHATHAVSTALQMHEAVDQLNLTLPQRGYPLLTLRAGICSGKVIVGDAGSKEFSDYTAMGDAVNTAARLESANKVFGTRTLVIRRTIELLEGQFLFRPIANLRVAGKTQGVDVFEPLCPLDKATPRQKQLAELSAEVVAKFQSADFPGCLAAVDRLDQAFGESKFTALYRELSREYQILPPSEFAGQVILTEK